MTGRRPKPPNQALAALLDGYGLSRKRLAFEVNRLAQQNNLSTAYKHSSVGRWLAGETPKDPVPHYIAAVLSARIGRPVTVVEIGMGTSTDDIPRGWDFPRDRHEALEGTRTYWTRQDSARTAESFAVAGYTLPVTRWLAVPADTIGASEGSYRVTDEDLTEMRVIAGQARLWDATFGGGDWRLSSVTQCLRDRAVPLLTGTYTEPIGRELFTIIAELSRVVAWATFDRGHSATAQRRFIQSLRLARAGGNVEMGAYILTTMALHTLLDGAPDHALDMAQGAFHRGRQHASLRVQAFAKLAEARAYGRLGDAPAASSSLSRAQRLLDKIQPDSHDPSWISYVTYGRLAADATEIFRDLRNPQAALSWSKQVTDMTPDRHTRAVGLRWAVVATAHCQARDLDQALDCGHQALSILARVSSARAVRYLRDLAAALAPWTTDPRVRDFTEQLERCVTDTTSEALAR